ncbi:chemotaxis protein CheW [Azospirillum soli]|uniref:chemotaxis protein CheW n=1 Tax=Azospirillum soli TaxID=1304799 RepID=UPI001AE42120|nr:chemotaxis protein CheW [Azospirillum soli]MBP2314272.1 purine-binding chemotaxis protein CheW [Azospirillum soli]
MTMVNAADGGETGIGGDTRQYVTFYVQDEMFAVPLAEVQEIIRMPDVVGIPKSPQSLEGIANLRGTVMSVTSLRRIFRFADRPHDDATRVVVINQGVPVGFVVDRMAAVVTVDPDQIEPAESLGATVETDLLRGMIKGVDGHAMIMIIDPARLIRNEGVSRERKRSSGGAADARTSDADEAASDELQLVSFEVARQEYALGIESVQEIVQVPGSISRIPCTDRHVLGVMTLRNRLLPLVSLRSMFRLPDAELDERSKIVVVPLDERNSVGVVMDTVREVLRVRKDVVDPLPNMLGDGRGEIQSICRLNNGKRLVSILSAEHLFRHDAVRKAVAAASEMEEGTGMAEAMAASRSATVDEEEQFVVFRLGNEEYGAPIDSVNEIVRVPDELTRVPKTASFIEGVVNLRGAVLPVIDQRRRFDLPEIERNDRQRIMVFTINGVRTGFIVDSVSEVLKIARSAIGPTPSLSDEQARLIGRVANLEKSKRMILLLDVANLLDASEVSAVGEAGGTTVH